MLNCIPNDTKKWLIATLEIKKEHHLSEIEQYHSEPNLVRATNREIDHIDSAVKILEQVETC